MRALILVLSLVVAGLAASILLHEPPPPASGPIFEAARLIANASEGEEATYMDGDGNTMTFLVEKSIPGAVDRPPATRIRRILRDRTGAQISAVSYDHMQTVHFIFPLTAPEAPQGLDRVWVWQRIRQESIEWRGKRRLTWRVDALDPAQPGDQDTVVAWLDDAVPVFGLLRWQGGRRTWSLVSSKPEA